MKKWLLPLIASVALGGSTKAQKCSVTISNPSTNERKEVVCLNAKQVLTIQKKLFGTKPTKWSVRDQQGKEVTTQYTHDGEFLIDASIQGKASVTYNFCAGQKTQAKSSVFLKMYPNRVDDIAWENNRIAFRAYGPALQKTGEKAYGIDVWVKNTEDMVVDARYDRELNPKHKAEIEELKKTDPKAAQELADSYTYHKDHGNGMDCYKVGPTLGCGAPAIMDKTGEIIYPWCYVTYQFLDEGPLRMTFSTTYEKKNLAGIGSIQEKRFISLDKGSQLNKITVLYDGMKNGQEVCTGLIIHAANTTDYKIDEEAGYLSYKDPTEDVNNNNGWIYTGCVFPQKTAKKLFIKQFTEQESKERRGDYGHLLGLTKYQAKKGFTYYAGAAWSKYNIRSLNEWNNYLQQFSDNLKKPLKISIK